MKRPFSLLFSLAIVVMLLGIGCGEQPAEESAEVADVSGALEEAMTIRDQAEQAYEAALLEIEPMKEEDPAAYLSELARVKNERESQYEDFTDKLVSIINQDSENVPAKKAYADYLVEFVAQAYIDDLGNYMKAVEVYEEALSLVPGDPGIEEKLAHATDFQFMVEERFEQVENGMTFEEVEAICGVPNPRLIKEQEAKGQEVIGWYYAKKDRSVAGFYFVKDTGKLYKKNFNAIKKPEVIKSGEEETE